VDTELAVVNGTRLPFSFVKCVRACVHAQEQEQELDAIRTNRLSWMNEDKRIGDLRKWVFYIPGSLRLLNALLCRERSNHKLGLAYLWSLRTLTAR
jgi:hypothetical protein